MFVGFISLADCTACYLLLTDQYLRCVNVKKEAVFISYNWISCIVHSWG